MRIIFLLILFFSFKSYSQSYLPGSFIDYGYRGNPAQNINIRDSISQKKWFTTRYSGLSTSFSFFKGGSATIISAPMGLQLNRRINDNVFAFAGLSVAPAYINSNTSFMNAGFNKFAPGSSFKSNGFGMYSRAALGLMYVSDNGSFSISGSVGIERNTFPGPAFNNLNSNQVNRILPTRQ